MVVEKTIRELRTSYLLGEKSVSSVVKTYINRIEEYDSELNSVIRINPSAEEIAEKRDAEISNSNIQGLLHGIPIVIKDNIDTADMPTTAGSKAFEEHIPSEDAHVVELMRSAGAIIIAKVNLGDFAAGYHSSIVGRTNNPYDLNRTPEGSSAGTGVAVSANFATVGIGTDTGGSVRQPSAYNGLFGLRPTPGLISRSGIIPVSYTQDTPGPMTRCVDDMAILLDVVTGYDMNDELTASHYQQVPQSYQSYLNTDSLSNTAFGVLRDNNKFVDRQAVNEDHQSEVNKVTKIFFETMENIESLGAEVIYDVEISGIWEATTEVDSIVKGTEFLTEIKKYMDNNDDISYKSAEDIFQSGKYMDKQGTKRRLNGIAKEINVELENKPLKENKLYQKNMDKRSTLRNKVIMKIHQNDLDVLAFPTFSIPPLEHNATKNQNFSNTHVASSIDLPSITIPIGFTNEHLPIAMDLIGPKYSESKLLEIARSFEQNFDPREPPTKFGPYNNLV